MQTRGAKQCVVILKSFIHSWQLEAPVWLRQRKQELENNLVGVWVEEVRYGPVICRA